MNSNTKWIGLAILVVAFAGLMYWRLTLTPAEPGTPDTPMAETAVTSPDTPPAEPAPETESAAAEPERPRLRTLPGEAPAKDDDPTRDTKPKRIFTGTGVINVSVIGLDGKPAANANVMVERIDWEASERPPAEGVLHEDTTGADGAVSFDKLPDGNYVARAHTTNGMQSADTRLTKDERVATVVLELWDSAPVNGTVVDTSGAGVAGAMVYVYETDRFAIGPLVSPRATQSRQSTDEKGQFQFPALWKGKWKLYAQAEGYASNTTDWFAVPGADIQIVLGEAGTISGTVVHEATGEPIPGVGVLASAGFARDSVKSASDAGGKFRIEGVKPGDQSLSVEDHEVALAGAPVAVKVVEGQETDGVELRVVAGGIIRGRVYDKDSGKGIPSARLDADSQGSGPSRPAIVTGLDGTYEVRGLGKAVYEVMPREAPGYPRSMDLPKSVSVTPGQVYEGIDFALDRGMALSGRVVDTQGDGIAGTQVQSADSNKRQHENDTTDAEGNFEIAGLTSGDFWLEASKAGYGRKPAGPFRVEKDGVSDIEIVLDAEASVAGTVVDKQGRPVALVPLYAQPIGSVFSEGHVASQPNGAFRIGGLGVGEHQIQMGRIRQEPWPDKVVETVTLRAGEHLEGLRLVYDFSEGGRIAGRATDTNGEPIAGVSITSWMNAGDVDTQTDSDGRYSAENIYYAESILLGAQHRQYSTVTFQATVGLEDNDFTMEGRGAIAGRVLDASTGAPIHIFELGHLRSDMFDSTRFYQSYRTITNESGEFLVEDVEAGTNTIYARAEGFAKNAVEVPGVREGEAVSGVEIRLDPAAAIEGIVVDNRGKPIVGAMVFDGGLPDPYVRDPAAVTTTDANGEFQIATMSPDTTEVWASHAGYLDGAATVSLAANATTRVEIVLRDGGAVEGTVREGGVPKAGAWVGVFDREGMNAQGGTQSDENGHYRVAGLPPQTVTVRSNLPPPATASRGISKQAELEEGMSAVVDFDFAGSGATLEGYVTRTGEPVAFAWVTAEVGSRTEGGEFAGLQTDDNGYYRIENVPAGEATITANDSRGGSKRIKATLASGAVTRVDIDFAAGQRVVATISGFTSASETSILLLTADAPIEDDLTPGTMNRLDQCCVVSSAQLGANGVAILEGVEPGDYILLAISFDQSISDIDERFSNALTGRTEVTVTEGETVEVDLTIR